MGIVMHTVILSLGANIGERKKNIRCAILRFSSFAEVKKCSKPYRTRPYGKTDQPDFINMALIAQTRLSPMEVLDKIHLIETELGRKRTVRWGERTIDIDIIFYDSDIISIKDLIVPHPDMQNRYFVLRPLLDICPEFVHPVLKKTISELYNELLDTLKLPSDCGACPG